MGGYLLTPETVYLLYVVLAMWPGPAPGDAASGRQALA